MQADTDKKFFLESFKQLNDCVLALKQEMGDVAKDVKKLAKTKGYQISS